MRTFTNIHMSKKQLYRLFLPIAAGCICCLPKMVEADYQSDVQIAAELWVDITYQDYLYLNGIIGQEEWLKEQNNFKKNFRHIKGNNPTRFDDDFARAVTKTLGIEYSPKAALMAIIAAPIDICVDDYREDIWRASQIQTKANEDLAHNTRNLGKQPHDSLIKAERDELYRLHNEKYGTAKNPVPIFQMFYRNYNMVFADEIVWSDHIPTATITQNAKRTIPQRTGVRKRPAIEIPVASICKGIGSFDKEVEKLEKLDQVAVQALIEARKLSDSNATSGIEYGGFIIEKDGQYLAGSPVRGKSKLISACAMANGLFQEGYGILTGNAPVEGYTKWQAEYCMYGSKKAILAFPNNTKIVATYHVHPPIYLAQDMLSRFFSKGDVLMAYDFNIKMYMLTPNCIARRHTPDHRMVKPDVFGEEIAPLLDPSVWGLTALTTKDLIVVPEHLCGQ